MKRFAAALVLMFAFPMALLAQEGEEGGEKVERIPGKWYPKVESGLTLTQGSYSKNWAGGDRGSVVWAFITNATLENQFTPKTNWKNRLKLAYGQTHQESIGDDGERRWEEPDKSTDLLDFESILRFTLGGEVDPFAAFRFESQFQDASDPFERGLIFNPMRFHESAGIARQFIDEEERSLLVRLGLTLRQGVRRLFENPPPDDATRTESTGDGGAELVTDYTTKVLNDRVAWTSKLILYQPFFFSAKERLEKVDDADLLAAGIDPDVEDFSIQFDADWENIFTTQITKLVSVQLYLRLVYDKYDNTVPPLLTEGDELVNPADVKQAIRKAGQFKQTLSLGLTYRLL